MTTHIDIDTAIARALDALDAMEGVKAPDPGAELKAERAAKEAAIKSRDKAKAELANTQKRVEKLTERLKVAQKEARQVRHELTQEIKKRDAAQARAKRDRGMNHPTIRSEDGKASVQLAYNQVHLHEPDRWYVVSSQPLDKSEKHRLVYCGLIDGIKQGDHWDFFSGAMQTLAKKWREEHGCPRIEDLELDLKLVAKIEDQGIELVSELPSDLTTIVGVGKVTAAKIQEALNRG